MKILQSLKFLLQTKHSTVIQAESNSEKAPVISAKQFNLDGDGAAIQAEVNGKGFAGYFASKKVVQFIVKMNHGIRHCWLSQ